MSLKELTHEKHELAETTPFMKAVFAGSMPAAVWADYTYQKYSWYQAIESAAESAGLLSTLPNIKRAKLIDQDCLLMLDQLVTSDLLRYKPSTVEYGTYIKSLTDPQHILAHLYVWHMGDLYGGQMIKKIIDAPHSHLEFENSKQLITAFRELLSDDLAPEANVAFDWAIKLLKEYDC